MQQALDSMDKGNRVNNRRQQEGGRYSRLHRSDNFDTYSSRWHNQRDLTIAQVKPRAENGARAGTQALRLLSTPINVFVLQALAEGPHSLVDLRREAGSPPQTTMRGHLRTLAEQGCWCASATTTSRARSTSN